VKNTKGNRVTFTYDRNSDVVFAEDHWEIRTSKDVDEFFDEYRKFFTNMGRKFWLVAHIDDLIIHPDATTYYGEVAQKVVDKAIYGYVRWGTKSYARLSLRTSSMTVKMHHNIFSSLEEAVEAINKMKTRHASET
jgi:hypothetical protein